ncbi:MAG: division/cell wall cluster transcriptional repressor MraZ [Alphaproteobacteria bacterium]|nr:division/cell wall cluster transcriptional repressor MraZ [Alphaproteobacteria bacterium]
MDKKGRVSVPAAFRATLATNGGTGGLIVYPDLVKPAIRAFGRDTLDEMSRQRHARTLESGSFEDILVGSAEPDLVTTILGLAHELGFDGEGRIHLPAPLVAHAGIAEHVSFVGRGPHFEIWETAALDAATEATLARARRRLAAERGS